MLRIPFAIAGHSSNRIQSEHNSQSRNPSSDPSPRPSLTRYLSRFTWWSAVSRRRFVIFCARRGLIRFPNSLGEEWAWSKGLRSLSFQFRPFSSIYLIAYAFCLFLTHFRPHKSAITFSFLEMSLLRLPHDSLREVLTFLPVIDVFNLRLTCIGLRNCVDTSSSLMWNKLFQRMCSTRQSDWANYMDYYRDNDVVDQLLHLIRLFDSLFRIVPPYLLPALVFSSPYCPDSRRRSIPFGKWRDGFLRGRIGIQGKKYWVPCGYFGQLETSL